MHDSLGRQKGAAMLIFLAILILATAAYLVADFNLLKSKSDKVQRTQQALNEAKLAVMSWSVNNNILCESYDDASREGELDCTVPGKLPCPEDMNLIGGPNEGMSKVDCEEPNNIGRLPWKTLGIGDIRDGNGDKLWYAVSSGFHHAPSNYNTKANLKISQQANAAVAIIFSPGQPLNEQKRINQTDVTQYLDLSNISGVPTFITGRAGLNFNDVMATITKEELFKVVNMRVLGEVRGAVGKGGVVDFYSKNGHYPYADIQGDGQSDDMSFNGTPSYEGVTGRDLSFSPNVKAMLKNNGWPSLIEYQVNPERTEVTLKLGNQSIQVKPIP